MIRVNPWTVGTAVTVAMAMTCTACAIAYSVLPEGTIAFFNSWLHGLDLSLLRSRDRPFTIYGFLYGLFGISFASFLIGAVYALVYNQLSTYADQDQPQTDRFVK